jgi:hypothetical protein
VTTIRLGCGRAGTLFYEPEGLLLRSCLIPVDADHREHLLTFQLGYLGAGEITVHVTLDGGPAGHSTSSVTTALLRGTDADEDEVGIAHDRIPSVWLTYATVPDNQVRYRYTVWGQPGISGDDLRGELITEITGAVPMLTATTRAGATRQPLPDVVRSQPVMDWDQASGSGAGHCPDRPRSVLAGRHQRAVGPIRNI